MKQGTGNSQPGSQKREPIAKAVSPGAVSQLGTHTGAARAVEKLYEGRGYEAPMSGSDTHKSGSQGKHR